MWQLIDNTNGKNTGYLMIMKDGVRVADAFPYAAKSDPAFVQEQARRIVEAMNKIDMGSPAVVDHRDL